jgi:hypothetical protein
MTERVDVPRDEVAVLVRAAGLAPSPAQFEEIVEAYGYVRAMTARLTSDYGYEVEPAHVFVPERTSIVPERTSIVPERT